MAWSKKPISWHDPDLGEACLSVVFTWDLPRAWTIATWWVASGYHVRAGGPAVRLMPRYLSQVADCSPGEVPDAIHKHNPEATITSRGCIRRCPFCAVPRTEGDLVELDDWTPRPIVSDNNLLACSHPHIHQVIDSLKQLQARTPRGHRPPLIDFNQGLDLRLLSKQWADRLAELDCLIRLSLDASYLVPTFMAAYERLRAAGFPKKRIRVYVLLGFDDTPDDALHRLNLIRDLGLTPCPMRYNPLDTLVRDQYVAPGWTETLLKRYMRYWSRLRYLGGIPFEQYDLAPRQRDREHSR